MSAIASFYLINKSKLAELLKNAEATTQKTLFGKKIIDNYYAFLKKNSTELPGFYGNGYVYGNVLPYLEDVKEIRLSDTEYNELFQELSEKRECSHLIITWQQKQAYLATLENSVYPLDELEKFNKEFSDEGGLEYARLALDAIKALIERIRSIGNDGQVLLIIIG